MGPWGALGSKAASHAALWPPRRPCFLVDLEDQGLNLLLHGPPPAGYACGTHELLGIVGEERPPRGWETHSLGPWRQ